MENCANLLIHSIIRTEVASNVVPSDTSLPGIFMNWLKILLGRGMSASAGIKCPRCKWNELTRIESGGEAAFYECANCVWRFAKSPGQSLHDRWGSPISIALYSQIFHADPQDSGREAAVKLYEERRDLVSWIIFEIRRELASPTQRVSEIHKFVCNDEQKLRKHLADMADHLAELRDS